MALYSCKYKREMFTWNFHKRSTENSEGGQVYGARFSSCGNFIIAGGGGRNSVKVFMNNCDSSATFKQLLEFGTFSHSVSCLDSCKSENMFAFGLTNGEIFVIRFKADSSSPEYEGYQGNFEKLATLKNRKQTYIEKETMEYVKE